jgi:hypothetical protein
MSTEKRGAKTTARRDVSLTVDTTEIKKRFKKLLDAGKRAKAEELKDWERAPHKEVLLKWGDQEAMIDEGIAPLILELWKANLFTLGSCQGSQKRRMGILFADVLKGQQFLNIVGRRDQKELYTGILFGRSYYSDEMDERWEYDFPLRNYSVSEGQDFRFSMSVRFPPIHYPILLERMKEYNSHRETRGE